MNKNILLAIGLVLAACLVVGGFAVFKNYKDKVSPPKVVVEKKTEQPQEPPAEEVAEEPVEEEPKVEKPKRRKANVTEDISRMNPMGGDQLPTKEEAVEEAWKVLNAYREASPEEKQQIATQLVMAQSIMNGFAQNADMLLQQMPEEMRSEVVNSASAALEIIGAVQEEMAGAVTPEEAMVFGGVFQSLQNLCESFSY